MAALTCDRAEAQEAAARATSYEVGLAKVDITPDYPIRLSGFSFRQTESEGVRQRIFARAMAVRAGGNEAAVLITVDSIAVPPALREEVARRLHAKRQIKNERLAICATHTHTAPSLSRILPTMFGAPVAADQQERIDRYTRELTDRVEQVALAALDDLRESRLSFGIGKARFAINRRTRGGPVDHDMPVIVITGPDGNGLRGIYVNYACHCVVLSDYKVSGDWAGYAAEEIEKTHPGAVALVSIGCGADSNPESGVTGDKGEVAHQYGSEIAAEVERLLRFKLDNVEGRIACTMETITLPLQTLLTREEWAKRAEGEGAEAYYAGVQLAAIDRGEKLPTEVAYPIQTWKFGDSLAAVFLPGEVVVDYSLRLKKEFDRNRLCINAYANDCPAYIPSERILKEGGYEGGGAMVYYGLPASFAPGLEDKIVSAVAAQLGDEFKPRENRPQPGTQGSLPKSPAESLASLRVRDGLRVELVASEPMVRDPVAIDFGPDGKVWVAEMIDYGFNIRERNPPLGRITVLEDRDSDGRFETATRFLENISMPMGVTVWRKGVLICAAPDILYAEDTTGDGKADVVKKLFSGFGVQNAQARVNGFARGLDGWLYGACTFGGEIENHVRGAHEPVPDGDFRMLPDHGVVESETGRTQQSRVRDDWGNWFGCNNTVLCFHYPLGSRYLERNPHVVPPSVEVTVASEAATQLFSHGDLVMFELSGPVGRPTSVCGIGFYRDELLGPEFNNNLFVCEPVHQLVHRMVLHPSGATFVGERASDEADSEFLTSTDNWFRPVQARTGPDGALWIVDMYRYVIEYSHWIPPAVVDTLDLRAGNELGRIYRVLPRDAPSRPLPRFDHLDTRQLAEAMDTPNGTLRDMVQQMLVLRSGSAAARPLMHLAAHAERPAVRLQALCTLELLGKLPDDLLVAALTDAHPGVRRNVVRLSESHLNSSPDVAEAVLRLADESDAALALQLAASLGALGDRTAKTTALAKLALRYSDDEYIITAILTSTKANELGELIRRIDAEFDNEMPESLLVQLVELAGTSGDGASVQAAIDVAASAAEANRPHRFSALVALLSGFGRNPATAHRRLTPHASRLNELIESALSVATDSAAHLATRLEAINVVGRNPLATVQHVRTLSQLLSAGQESALQVAAIDALAMQAHDEVAKEILSAWPSFTPSLRTKAVEALLGRKRWAYALVTAIDNEAIPASQLDTAQRARLVAYPDAEIRQMAERHFSQTASGERAAVLARYEKSKTGGDASRGKALYQKHCANCHEFRGAGSRVGPALDASEYRAAETMLREILDPNRAIDGRYAEYVAITASGRVKNGILVEESGNTITLRGQQGEETRLLRSELDSLTSTGNSLMPEGFEKDIPPADMADLLAYLCSR